MARKRKSGSGNMTTWLILGGIIIAGYFWLRQQLDLIQVGGISVPFQKLEGTRVHLTIRISIINASSLAAKITGFTGFILSPEGSVLSTVFLTRPANIPRYQQADLDFTSYIGATAIATELYNILSSGQQPNWKGYRLKGQLRVYGLPVPIETTLV